MKTITTISKEELKRKIDGGGNCQIVNVLSPEYYHLGFIKGSLRIPVAELEKRSGELDRSREVIVYCASSECHASRLAAEKLDQLGFHASAYEGGIKEWKEAGFPIEADKEACSSSCSRTESCGSGSTGCS